MSLNGSPLLARQDLIGPWECDVTSILRDRNELIVDVECLEGSSGLWGEVALEIRGTAFLRNVEIWLKRNATDKDSRLHASGEVVGHCDGILELYLIAGNRNVGYQVTKASPEGQAF